MNEPIRISAKNLGEVALTEFCPRCFWIKLRLGNKLPFQIFPGIFASIDSYNKKIIQNWFDRHHKLPEWLQSLGDISGYEKSPHHSIFQILDERNNILLTGDPDAVFVYRDGSYLIVDYKTARYTGTQDKLYPMYEAQLNAYVMIGIKAGLAPVSKLALIYMEPLTDYNAIVEARPVTDDGFLMGFKANIHEVRLDTDMLHPLLAKVREIYELSKKPEGRADCENCKRLIALASLFP